LFTFGSATLHGWLAGAILLFLVLWIAAYADHRRATETRSSREKRKGLF